MADKKVTVVLSAKDRASKVFEKFGGTLKVSVVGGAAAATAALATLAFALFKSAEAASKAERVDARLDASLRNVRGAASDAADQIRAYALRLRELTGVSDDQIKSAAAMLGTFQLTEGQIISILPRLLDMAAATEKSTGAQADLEQIAIALGKAFTGQVGLLARYGVVLDDATAKSGDFNQILKDLDTNFKGTAESLGTTFQGRLDVTTEKFGDMTDEFGFMITESEAIKEVLDVAGNAFVVLSKFVESNRGTIQDWIARGILPVLDASAATADALADFSVIVEEVTGSIQTNINETDILKGALAAASGQLIPLVKLLGVYADVLREDREESGDLTDDTVMLSETLDGLTESIRAGADSIRDIIAAGKDGQDAMDGMAEGARGAAGANAELLASLEALPVGVGFEMDTAAQVEAAEKAVEIQRNALKEIEQLNFEASESKRAILERELEDQLEHYEAQLEFEGVNAEERLALKEFEAQRRMEIDLEVDEHNRELALENLNFGQELAIESVETLTQGLATFVEAAILNAENIKEVGEGVIRSLVGSVVGGLARMATQFLVNAILHRVAKKQEGASALSANLAAVFSGAYAATAAIPIVGPALAPGVAAASLAAAAAGSTAAAATGAGLGAGIVAQEGGFVPMLPGASPNSDSVMAMLTPGELIIPRPFVEEIGRAERFQEGGVVGGGAEAAPAGGAVNAFILPAEPSVMGPVMDAISEAVERFGFRLVASEVSA